MATVAPGVAPSSARAWWLAARPRTLPLAAAPVAVGSALAASQGQFASAPALAALLGALFLQVGSNFANDVYDAERGTDDATRIGPARAVQSGWISAVQMQRGMVLAFLAATAVGLYLVAVGGWPIVAIGVLAIVAAYAYTGGPYPLGYHGLGEAAVFLFFGLVAVGGSYYVQAQSLPWLALASALPVGALASAVLVVNNVRDLEGDRRAGKRTLAVRFGRTAGVAEYGLLQGIAQLVPVALWLAGAAGPFVLATLLTLPQGIGCTRTLVRHQDGPTLNECLASTAQLTLLHSALFAAGLLA